MASFIFKLGSLDLSQYVRVGPQDGMDPYGSGWLDPAFSDAPLGEGQPLLLVDAKNRQMAWPLYPKAATKDALHTLIQQVNLEIANAARPLRVEWRDEGATNSTFYDVTFARIDPHYNFRLSQHFYTDVGLVVWCAPPYGHTATERVIATAAGTGGVLVASLIGMPSPLAGDVPALALTALTMSGNPVGPRGRIMGQALLPHPSYVAFIPAASLISLDAQATLTGASGAPGSQVIAPATSGLATTGQFARFALPASPYAGDNRLLAVARPGRLTGMAIHVRDDFDQPVGPTAVVRGIGGMQLADVGVARVGTLSATSVFTIGAGRLAQFSSDDRLQTTVGLDQNLGQLAGIIVVPDAALQVLTDPGLQIAGRWFGATNAATAMVAGSTDDYGVAAQAFTNDFMAGASRAWAIQWSSQVVSGLQHSVLPQVDPVGDQRTRLVGNFFTQASDAFAPFARIAKYNTWPVVDLIGMPSPALKITGQQTTATVPLQATTLLNAPSNSFVLDFVTLGDQAYGNLRLTNATGVGIVAPAGATTVPIACVGLTGQVRAQRAQVYLSGSATTTNGPSAWYGFLAYSIEKLSAGAPVPSDVYTLDGLSASHKRTPPGVGSMARPLTARGAAIRPTPSAAAVAVFDAHVDGGSMNDQMGVEIRVRERFTYAR